MKRLAVLAVLGLFLGLALSILVTGYRDDSGDTDLSWRGSSYNRQMTACLERYADVARVYDFDKMSDRTDEQLSEITGVNDVIVGSCRRESGR